VNVHKLRLADIDCRIAQHAAMVGPTATAGGIDRAAPHRCLDILFGENASHQSSFCKSLSSASTDSSKTAVPAAISSGVVASSGAWLRPPRQGTKIIAALLMRVIQAV